ncbi:hypothetical protein SAMN04487963_3303 [Marinobacter zhejiangensis]|uniref:Uncharacterized protein n=1 Tax=Marinobacter zhejiangensis TaxID=488535 RepID=A0A1I4SSS5_9GAMM|nr:hypothetical protein SAMN04487963_3303 [Marinobacter zhejiangensis]
MTSLHGRRHKDEGTAPQDVGVQGRTRKDSRSLKDQAVGRLRKGITGTVFLSEPHLLSLFSFYQGLPTLFLLFSLGSVTDANL